MEAARNTGSMDLANVVEAEAGVEVHRVILILQAGEETAEDAAAMQQAKVAIRATYTMLLAFSREIGPRRT